MKSRFELNVIKNKEEKLICIGCNDDDIVELWYHCLIYLNNIKY